MSRRLIPLILLGLCTAFVLAAPPAPTPPDTYNVLIRYQIIAFRNERLRQYAEMTRALGAAGFVRDPDEDVADDEPDNPKATRMRGTVPAKGVARLLLQRHVRTLVLYPADTKLPAKATPVRVDVRLASGYAPDIQRQLARQTTSVLTRDAGFVEAVGYDRLGDTRLVGSVPVENLDKLLEDVRKLPSADEGTPLSNVSAIRAVYARPDW